MLCHVMMDSLVLEPVSKAYMTDLPENGFYIKWIAKELQRFGKTKSRDIKFMQTMLSDLQMLQID